MAYAGKLDRPEECGNTSIRLSGRSFTPIESINSMPPLSNARAIFCRVLSRGSSTPLSILNILLSDTPLCSESWALDQHNKIRAARICAPEMIGARSIGSLG
jgi:hypothetical protein